MIVALKGKEYKTGKLVMHHAIVAMEMSEKLTSGKMSELESVDLMVEILAESLINGTERVPYDEIKADHLAEYKKIIRYNLPLTEIEPIYVQLIAEMSGKHTGDEGK